MTAPYYVYDLLVDENLGRWNGPAALGSPVTITYSFPTTQPASTAYAGYTTFNPTEEAAARSALAYISSLTNITFTEVASGGALSFGNADLTQYGSSVGGRGTYNNNNSGIFQGSVVLSNTGGARLDNSDFTPGSITSTDIGGHAWSTLLHEIGHALGLKHPFDRNGASDPNSVLTTAEDDLAHSIMSYTPYDPSNVAIVTGDANGYSYRASNLTPQGYSLYDIAALQYLYGVDAGTGNNTYAFHHDTPTYVTIADRGLNNTIDCSDLTGPNRIDMRAGTFSDLSIQQEFGFPLTISHQYDGTSALSIAYGAKVSNYIGGSGVDDIIGNGFANRIDGGAGADIMKGGADNDTYVVDNVGDKVIEGVNLGVDSVETNLAGYTLTANVERLTFTDTGNHVGKGNELSNRINGNAGLDKFIIDAGGNDVFSGGSGEDTFDARSSATGMVLRLDAQANNAGSVAGDTFASIEKFFGSDTAADQMTTGAARAKFFGYGGNDTLIGGSSIDALSGGAGNDSLVGNGGQDALDGGVGNDTMTGGAAADTFTFVDAAFGKDVITDFQDGIDKLKVFSAIADSFSDFTVTGNGSHHVVLTLASATANTITLDNASANITVSSADFLFY